MSQILCSCSQCYSLSAMHRNVKRYFVLFLNLAILKRAVSHFLFSFLESLLTISSPSQGSLSTPFKASHRGFDISPNWRPNAKSPSLLGIPVIVFLCSEWTPLIKNKFLCPLVNSNTKYFTQG